MINKISFKNYKAFAKGELKVRPLTILLGANNVGKSSILQLLLLLQQTALTGTNYQSALKLNGGYVSLGEAINLFRNKETQSILTLEIDFKSNEIFSSLKEDYFERYCQEVYFFTNVIQELILVKDEIPHEYANRQEFISSIRVPYAAIEKMTEPSFFRKAVQDASTSIQKFTSEDVKAMESEYFYYRDKFGSINHFECLKNNIDEYYITYDFLSNLKKHIQNRDFSVTFELITANNRLIVNGMRLRHNSFEILSLKFTETGKSEFVTFMENNFSMNETIKQKIITDLKAMFKANRTIFTIMSDRTKKNDEPKNRKGVIAPILRTMINDFASSISSNFMNESINYVSPVRAHPKRYYFLDKARFSNFLDTTDGDSIAEFLKQNRQLRIKVNIWLKKFNIRLKVEQLQDIIHKIIIKQEKLNLDITDVGFGISQILPVITQGFLSNKNSLTIIEQPEIHLHPKMQADLADLFIDIVKTEKIDVKEKYELKTYLLIETHSEYLLRRLRRRISEGVISSKDVIIYVIDPQEGEQGANIKELSIAEKGDFEWPKDFYGGELLNDTTEFLKNQIN